MTKRMVKDDGTLRFVDEITSEEHEYNEALALLQQYKQGCDTPLSDVVKALVIVTLVLPARKSYE